MSKDAAPARGGRKIVAQNRRARHEYDIEDSFEAGLVLTGTEIKSIRAGHVQLQDAYARIKDDEVWLYNMHVAPYEQGGAANVETNRTRKLLLHRREITRLITKVEEKGLALIPLSVYLKNGFAKVDVAIAKGRKLYDKRQAIAERDARREQDRALSERR